MTGFNPTIANKEISKFLGVDVERFVGNWYSYSGRWTARIKADPRYRIEWDGNTFAVFYDYRDCRDGSVHYGVECECSRHSGLFFDRKSLVVQWLEALDTGASE